MNILIAKQLEFKILHVLLSKFGYVWVLKKRSMKKLQQSLPATKINEKMI